MKAKRQVLKQKVTNTVSWVCEGSGHDFFQISQPQSYTPTALGGYAPTSIQPAPKIVCRKCGETKTIS